jgi:glutaredoxin
MIEQLINTVKEYQVKNGVEFDPQIIVFKLHNCKVCKSLESNLMVDGWSYETFDCLDSKHNDIADHVEDVLQSNNYPIVFVTYPETKILIPESPVRHEKLITNLNPELSIYEQLINHLS